MDEIQPAILQSVVIYGTIGIAVLILAINIVRRKKNRLANTIAAFYLWMAIAMFTNVAYRLVDNYDFNIIGNKIVIYPPPLPPPKKA